MPENVSVRCVVVVVNYGSHELIERNFRELDVRNGRLEIVIVDNFSSAEERSAVRTLCSNNGWILIESKENLGFGGGVNLGVRRAKEFSPDTLLLLNPDALINASAITELSNLVIENPNRLVCPRIEDTSGTTFFAGALVDMSSGRTLGTGSPKRRSDGNYREWFTGACLAFSPSLWERVGGFDDDYFLYWEDIDFSFRAERAGACLHFASQVVVLHDEGGTQQSSTPRTKSELYYYYNIRNRMLFARKWLPSASRRRWLMTSVAASWEIILRGGRRQLIQSVVPWRALSRGLLDGWKDRRGARA